MSQELPQSGLKYVDPAQGKEFWIHHLHRYQNDELAALRARLSKENETLLVLIRRFNIELDRGVSIENDKFQIAKSMLHMNGYWIKAIDFVLRRRKVQERSQGRLPAAQGRKNKETAFVQAALKVLTSEQLDVIQKIAKVEEEFSE